MSKSSLKRRIPIKIQNEEELRLLWLEFKQYMLEGKSGHVTENQKIRITGAALFVDFMCGIPPKKRTSQTSYLKYPNDPWPMD